MRHHQALRRIPTLHTALFFAFLLGPLALVGSAAAVGLVSGGLAIGLLVVAAALTAYVALAIGGLMQALVVAGARLGWERRGTTLGAAWHEVRPLVGSILWRGMGDGLMEGHQIASWVYQDSPRRSEVPQHRVMGRKASMAMVFSALILGLPGAAGIVRALIWMGAQIPLLPASFFLGLLATGALLVFIGGLLGLVSAVAAAAEHHHALHGAPPPGFEMLQQAKTHRGARPVQFQRA